MRRLVALVALAVPALLVTAVPALGHSVRYPTPAGSQPQVASVFASTDPFTVGTSPPTVAQGPCTRQSAEQQYPDGDGHDHLGIEVHAAACALRQQAFLPLKQELGDPASGARDDEVLGEMDVEGDIAAVAIAFPRAGVLFFDVSDPTQPRFLRKYAGAECEGTLIDVDCGAFVDLSEDGSTAFLSVQQISVVPGSSVPGVNPPVATPGVEVISSATGRLTGQLPVVSIGGVHTSRDHVVPDGPKSPEQPRRPGHYVFSVANGLGIEISRVVGPTLTPVGRIDIDEVHDMFIQDDPLTGRTLMYVAAGFDTGFLVYDVTDPQAALGENQSLLAQWDLTPQCEEDWYSHTIDVTTRGGRRLVTMPAELFLNGANNAEDRGEGCGAVSGNGDKVGPLWIVDATDFDALGRGTFANAVDGDGDATENELKAASQKALVTTWTNAAGRPGQNLNFSPHNQQIVGDRIYLSGYHSGVTVLDASAAFAGRNERPKEVGFIVPSGTPTRPIYDQALDPLIPFFTAFIDFRPLIWDLVFYRGSVLAADMTGGFYSFGETGPAGSPAPGGPQGQAPAQECVRAGGFRSVNASGRRSRVRLDFARRVTAPVSIDVFQTSVGRRVIGERLVARFTGRERGMTWNGRANRNGRTVTDGYFFARYSLRQPNGRLDVRRVALRRVNGRFSVRRSFYRRDSCSTLRSFKLERPVFGGRSNRALGVSFQLNAPARVTVEVLRGGRVIRRLARGERPARRTIRLRFDSEGRPRGDYGVRITVTRGGRTVRSTLTSRRL